MSCCLIVGLLEVELGLLEIELGLLQVEFEFGLKIGDGRVGFLISGGGGGFRELGFVWGLGTYCFVKI